MEESCIRATLAAIEEGEKRGRPPVDGVPAKEEDDAAEPEAGEGVEKAESEPSAVTGLTPLGWSCDEENEFWLGRAGVEATPTSGAAPTPGSWKAADRGDTLVNGEMEEESMKGDDDDE
jgi:hypothetical protein